MFSIFSISCWVAADTEPEGVEDQVDKFACLQRNASISRIDNKYFGSFTFLLFVESKLLTNHPYCPLFI